MHVDPGPETLSEFFASTPERRPSPALNAEALDTLQQQLGRQQKTTQFVVASATAEVQNLQGQVSHAQPIASTAITDLSQLKEQNASLRHQAELWERRVHTEVVIRDSQWSSALQLLKQQLEDEKLHHTSPLARLGKDDHDEDCNLTDGEEEHNQFSIMSQKKASQ